MSSVYLATNKGSSTVGANFNATATAITLATGEGARFPSPTNGDYTLLILQNTAGVREIICVVGRAADVVTVGIPGSAAANVLGRNYEAIYGMSAASWVIGDVVSCRPTAGLLAAARGAVFDVGTAVVFAQTSAPTGWTKSTTHNNKALRVVSGTAGSGGTVPFTSAFAAKTPAGTVGGTAISTAQMPSHSHTGTDDSSGSHSHSVSDPGHSHNFPISAGGSGSTPNTSSYSMANLAGFPTDAASTGISIVAGGGHTHTFTTAAAGSGSTHTHSFTGEAIDLAVQYVDTIIATKD